MSDKLNTINRVLRVFPSPLAGLALAIASLGLCWESAVNLGGNGQLLGAILASCLVVPLFLKFVFNPHLLMQDLQHPIGGSVAPTTTMAMMTIAHSIGLYSMTIGKVISVLAIFAHLFFLLGFIVYRSRNFTFSDILPSWFIPPIGLVVAPLMYPGGLDPVLSVIILLFAVIAYALLLPGVLWRLVFSKKLCDSEKPTLVILATPASLILIGYFALVAEPSYLLVAILMAVALVMTLSVYAALPGLLRLPFMPAYSAFTFPLVVGALALFKTSAFLMHDGFEPRLVAFTVQFAHIELLIATLMVAYVCLRYMLYFLPLKGPDLFSKYLAKKP